MKFVIFAAALIAIFVAVSPAPASISGNNIGDVINVGVNAHLKVNSTVNQDIVSVIVALLNQQRIGVDLFEKSKIPATSPKSADMINKLLSKH